MKNTINRAGLAAAAATAAIGLGVGPAAAASITVTGGGAYTAVTSGGVTLSAGATLSCGSGTAAGSVTAGGYTTPAQIGTMTNTAWTNCGYLSFPATWKQNGTWQLWATGAPASGVTPIEVRNLDLTINIPALGCALTVTGTAGGTFDNASQDLSLTGTNTLTVAKSATCPTTITSPGALTVSYAVSAASAITIS